MPTFCRAGDMNGDGIPDIVATNSTGNTLLIFISKGDGTFQEPHVIAAGSTPTEIALADLNLDGRLDIAVTLAGSNRLGVFLNKPTSRYIGQSYNIVAPALPSVVLFVRTSPANATTTQTYRITFSEPVTGVDDSDFTLAANGTIIANAPVVSNVTASIYDVTVGGIAGSGNLTLTLRDDGTIRGTGNRTLTNLTKSSFELTQTVAASTVFQTVVADLNGDGIQDLVALTSGFQVRTYVGFGNGKLVSKQNLAITGSSAVIAIGDMTGDGKADLVLTNDSGGNLRIYPGIGDGSFATAPVFTQNITAFTPSALTLGDANGDGVLDVLVNGFGSASAYLFLGNGDGSLKNRLSFGLLQGGGGQQNGKGGLQARKEARQRLEEAWNVEAARRPRRR